MLVRAAGCVQRAARRYSSLRTDETYDLIVVGGGVMGAWTAVMAREMGASVVLADQFLPAHEHGSSHGDGRIYRLAYNEDLYVDMMLRSLPRWHELQAFAGEDLLTRTGGLNLAPTDGAGVDRDLKEQSDLYARRGIEHEWLTAGEVNARFPQFQLAEGKHAALFSPEIGILRASKCVAAAWRYAASLGVHTCSPFRASSLAAPADGVSTSEPVVVEGDDGTILRGRSLVLAPGAWLTTLARDLLGLSIPTHVSAETVCYYAPRAGCTIDHSFRSMRTLLSSTQSPAYICPPGPATKHAACRSAPTCCGTRAHLLLGASRTLLTWYPSCATRAGRTPY